MGAVSDLVNIGDSSRFKAWLLAIATAIVGVTLLEYMSIVDIDESRIPYRNFVFFWPRYILGGIMFGIGMTLASGCGNKILIRIGGGNNTVYANYGYDEIYNTNSNNNSKIEQDKKEESNESNKEDKKEIETVDPVQTQDK